MRMAPGVTALAMDDAYRDFRDLLSSSGWLMASEAAGIYARTGKFEQVVRGIDAAVTRVANEPELPVFHFPLVVPSALLGRSGYAMNFPDLTGVVKGYGGGERGYGALVGSIERGELESAWDAETGVGLCAAACHPLYPLLSGCRLPPGGRRFEVFGQVFRREPSPDPARMQAFRQHEIVYVGDAAGAMEHRDAWVKLGLTLHRRLGLEVEAVVANDPFFGRSGRLLAESQREHGSKMELVAPIASERPTAITSANCHLDHFGESFGLADASDQPAHSACVGFGSERITLALIRAHGFEIEKWPGSVTKELGW